MKWLLFLFLLLPAGNLLAQGNRSNIIIVTTDGFRWQELFGGMDSAIANNPSFNQGDSAYIYTHYWDTSAIERRKKLMPFFWEVLAAKGILLGDRYENSRVSVSNPHWFSYPGYSEIFTGTADSAINSNNFPPNPHTNVLEFLHKQPALRGKVAAFGAWNAFDRILNEQRSGFPVYSAFDSFGGKAPTQKEKWLNELLAASYKPFLEGECLDMFTHYGAMEFLRNRKPRVLYIAYGETDEWAHAGQYRSYLDAAHQVDQWLQELWNYLQADPQYRNNTTLLITTDHGRGDVKKEEWTSHGASIRGADEIWIAAMGPFTPHAQMIRQVSHFRQQQLAATIAALMGYQFTAGHPVAEPIRILYSEQK